jgi:hypothetical protein
LRSRATPFAWAARARAITENINEAGLRVPIISAADLVTDKLAARR